MGIPEALINAGASIANATNSQSTSQSSNVSDASSWGASASNAYNQADSVSDSYAYSKSSQGSQNYGYDMGGSQNYSDSLSRTFGTEASAKSLEMAREANEIQEKNWLQQAQYNSEEAEISRNYQEYMSNTAYQRAVADLLAAGLNPILAVGNMGASTPVGATASSGLSSSHMGTATADSYSSGHSQGSSWNRGETSGKSWGSSKSESTSHGESHSKGGSSSWSKEGSKSHSQGSSSSQSTSNTQLKDFMKGVEQIGNYVNGGSAKTNAGKVAKDVYNGTTNSKKWHNPKDGIPN